MGGTSSKRNNPGSEPLDPAGHSTRLPLEIGTSALWNFTRGALLLPCAVGLGLLVLASGNAVVWIFGGIFVVLPVLAQGLSNLGEALGELPSDVLISRDGVRVEGKNGLAARWEELAADRCRLVSEEVDDRRLWRFLLRALAWTWYAIHGVFHAIWSGLLDNFGILVEDLPDPDKRYGKAKQAIYKLELGLASGQTKQVAEAETKDERESLQALLDTIHSHDSAEAEPADTGKVKILVCPACGAVVAPAVATEVQCRYCGASVPVPADLRQRIEAAQAVSEDAGRIERMAARLLRQPGATRVKWWLLGAFSVGNLSWLVAGAVLYHLVRLEHLDAKACGVVLGSVLVAVAGVGLLARSLFIDRHALRILTLDFAARPPRAEGEPHRCRECGAPLVESPGRVVLRCVYCNAENILGLDLRRRSRSTRKTLASLEQAFAHRRRARLGWAAVGALAVCMLGASGTGFAAGYRYRSPFAALRDDCLAGKRAACDRLLGEYARVKLSAADLRHVEGRACLLGEADKCEEASEHEDADYMRYARKGCELGRGELCADAARALIKGRHGPRNVPGGMKLYERACELGCAWGCNNLGAQLDATPASRRKNAARILHLYDHACTMGSAVACDNLADVYEKGRLGVLPDVLRSLLARGGLCKEDEKHCDALADELHRLFGLKKKTLAFRLHLYGLVLTLDPDGQVLKNPPPGLAHALKAAENCDQKRAAACEGVARWYEERADGKARSADRADALHYLGLACKLGSTDGCNDLAEVYEEGRLDAPLDPLRGLVERVRACALEKKSGLYLGTPPSCDALEQRLGAMHGMNQRQLLAAVGSEQDCEGDKAAGCASVATWYRRRAKLDRAGAERATDVEAAGRYGARACKLGSRSACAGAK